MKVRKNVEYQVDSKKLLDIMKRKGISINRLSIAIQSARPYISQVLHDKFWVSDRLAKKIIKYINNYQKTDKNGQCS